MKFQFSPVAAIAAVLLHIVTAKTIDTSAREERSETERIIGGEPAEKGQFPWAAALFINGQFICTCSIISEMNLLTAAHCVQFNGTIPDAGQFNAIADVSMISPTLRIDIADIKIHPNYNESAVRNDLAVLTTTQPIVFSDTVQPICIAGADTGALKNEKVYAMGWGDVSKYHCWTVIPDILQYVEQDIISNARCSLYLGPVEDTKICARRLFKGICNGDSGGPLVLFRANERPVQIGIASYIHSFFRCYSITPGVWTRISSFNDFILENTDDVAISKVKSQESNSFDLGKP